MFKKLFRSRIRKIKERFYKQDILLMDETANFFGQESLGSWKIRGNGVLLLTKNELFFEMWKPRKQIAIPIDSISQIENPRSFLGKSVFKPLLKVIFENKDAKIDSIAWYVKNLNEWNEKLFKLTSK
ncbi:MAG: hypothetical protein ACFFC9_14895 [Promethearchaeota archaeon]